MLLHNLENLRKPLLTKKFNFSVCVFCLFFGGFFYFVFFCGFFFPTGMQQNVMAKTKQFPNMQTLNREIQTNLYRKSKSLCIFLQTKMFGILTLGLQCHLSDFTAQQMSKLCTDQVL